MGVPVKVLVVDDDLRMVRTICDILKVNGFNTLHALTGEEAVGVVKAEAPDCVLMDVKMPGLNGIEALAAMKRVVPTLPVVLMSAYATEEQAEEARAAGAYAILTKPIDIQQILSFLTLLRKDKSILVVDDDPAFSRTLKDILRARKYQVETVDDPGDVLQLMERTYKLVVLLDIRLGGEEGLEVLRDIRLRYPTKPVILITGYRERMASTIEMGLKIGAYACLYKPLEMEQLVGIIEEISRKKLCAFLGEPF